MFKRVRFISLCCIALAIVAFVCHFAIRECDAFWVLGLCLLIIGAALEAIRVELIKLSQKIDQNK